MTVPKYHHILGSQIIGRMADIVFYRQRAKRTYKDRMSPAAPPRNKWYRPDLRGSCNCKAFALCDKIYQEMPYASRLVWSHAIKAPYYSAYGLWMKECLACMQAGDFAPDWPSPSGGYSTRHVEPGSTHAPPDECIKLPPIPPCEACDLSYVKITIAHPPACRPEAEGPYVLACTQTAPDCWFRWQTDPAPPVPGSRRVLLHFQGPRGITDIHYQWWAAWMEEWYWNATGSKGCGYVGVIPGWLSAWGACAGGPTPEISTVWWK